MSKPDSPASSPPISPEIADAERELGRPLTPSERADIQAGAAVIKGKIVVSSEETPAATARR